VPTVTDLVFAIHLLVLVIVGEILTVDIYTSAKETGIGKWLLAMKAKRGRKQLPRVNVTNDLIIIFNPWAKRKL